MSDVTFGTWSAVASPVLIEYSLVVLEEIRREVAEGFQKLSRGGIEVGGLLYGMREGNTVRIMAIRPAACEHASGPAFRLSERDRAALREQMRLDQKDPRLEGLVRVGWYISHTRTEISLTESDQEIFATFFEQPWQVTLVVRPSRGGNMRAGFFVRESDGSVNATQSHLEFNFPDRLAGTFERRAPEPRGVYRPAEPIAPSIPSIPKEAAEVAPVRVPVASQLAPSVRLEDSPSPAGITSPGMTSLFGEPEPASQLAAGKKPSATKWILAAVALIVLAGLAVAGARFISIGPRSESLALSVLEREGQLDIQWNRAAEAVSKAVSGELEIVDGPQTRTIPLSAAELGQGKFSYKRETGDIQVRMSVAQSNGAKVQEASRFLGPAPAKGNAAELKALEQRRDELEAEVTRLKQSNDQQSQRLQQLERTLKILQARPGIN